MRAATMLANLKNGWRRRGGEETGSSIIEMAIVFPILLILFVGTAELGRLFYTYTTLAKATDVGARYLSTSRNVVNGIDAQAIADEKMKAKNLVVCGVKSSLANACMNQTAVVQGLSIANVNICDNFSVPCNPVIPAGTTKHFRVEIINYSLQPGVFNLATMTGRASNKFYFALKPGTDMRYMP